MDDQEPLWQRPFHGAFVVYRRNPALWLLFGLPGLLVSLFQGWNMSVLIVDSDLRSIVENSPFAERAVSLLMPLLCPLYPLLWFAVLVWSMRLAKGQALAVAGHPVKLRDTHLTAGERIGAYLGVLIVTAIPTIGVVIALGLLGWGWGSQYNPDDILAIRFGMRDLVIAILTVYPSARLSFARFSVLFGGIGVSQAVRSSWILTSERTWELIACSLVVSLLSILPARAAVDILLAVDAAPTGIPTFMLFVTFRAVSWWLLGPYLSALWLLLWCRWLEAGGEVAPFLMLPTDPAQQVRNSSQVK